MSACAHREGGTTGAARPDGYDVAKSPTRSDEVDQRTLLLRELSVPAVLMGLGLVYFAWLFLMLGDAQPYELSRTDISVKLLAIVAGVGGFGFLVCMLFGLLLDSLPLSLFKLLAISVFAYAAVDVIALPGFITMPAVYALLVWKVLDLDGPAIIPVALTLVVLHVGAVLAQGIITSGG